MFCFNRLKCIPAVFGSSKLLLRWVHLATKPSTQRNKMFETINNVYAFIIIKKYKKVRYAVKFDNCVLIVYR